MSNLYSANQDIRDYMADHCVTQRMLASAMGVSQTTISKMMRNELSHNEKENLIQHIDAIANDAIEKVSEEEPETSEETEEVEQTNDVTVITKFQIGDRVKIPSKSLCVGIVSDIWHSLVQDKRMYAVDMEGGSRGLYAENQLEPAPLPIEYTFNATVENNVAVVCMIATQGEKTWVYARGHAHILHDGAVGEAQAVSYAARRMFESLDTKQDNPIYFKGDK